MFPMLLALSNIHRFSDFSYTFINVHLHSNSDNKPSHFAFGLTVSFYTFYLEFRAFKNKYLH